MGDHPVLAQSLSRLWIDTRLSKLRAKTWLLDEVG